MKTFVFQPGMTWGKLGYSFYSNSLDYRRVLESNPKWKVTELPPPGAVLIAERSPSVAGLSQQPSVLGRPLGDSDLTLYPYKSEKEYYDALGRYTPSTLLQIQRLNGWAMDSDQVVVGRVG